MSTDPVTITTTGPAPDALVTEQEYQARESARPQVSSESPFVTVDTEAQFDSALAAGRSIYIRGEGSQGIVALANQKAILHDNTTIAGPGCLRFTLDQIAFSIPKALHVAANDVTIRNLEITCTNPIGSTNCYGIVFSEVNDKRGHRLKLKDVHIHNWCRCVSKDAVPFILQAEDCIFERVYAHTFRDTGMFINYGLTRMKMRDSRIVGRLPGETHPTANAFYGGSHWEDNTIENCLFTDVDWIGFETTCLGYEYFHHRTHLYGCRAENCGSMGMSLTFGEGMIVDKCVIKNVKWIGIEFAGRAPGHDAAGYRYVQGIIDGCEIDTVKPHPNHGVGQVHGISIDGAINTVVRGGTRVRGIAADPNGSVGITVMGSEKCSIRGATLEDAGNAYIYVARGNTPNTSGFHEVVGNTFRNLPGSGAHQAVSVLDTTVEVRQNTVWQKPGTTLDYICDTVLPAKVTVDGALVPPHKQNFSGSNLILTG